MEFYGEQTDNGIFLCANGFRVSIHTFLFHHILTDIMVVMNGSNVEKYQCGLNIFKEVLGDNITAEDLYILEIIVERILTSQEEKSIRRPVCFPTMEAYLEAVEKFNKKMEPWKIMASLL